MVLAVKIRKQDAETARKKLIEAGAVDFGFVPESDDDWLYIPVHAEQEGYDNVEREMEVKESGKSLREALEISLNKDELAQLKTAYDLVGDIAILEIDEGLRNREKLIGETLLSLQPSVHVVVRKDGKHEGELRLQDYVWLAGEQRFETIAVENGVRLSLDIRKTYYSVRSSTERKRVAELVRPGERVLVMFSGIAPFPLVIGKTSGANEIFGVELNEDAHTYAEKNVVMNKVEQVRVVQGDVRIVVPGLGLFDRIVMPLPHTAEDFLDIAVPACAKSGMIHLYQFASEEEMEQFGKELPGKVQELGKTCVRVEIVRCGNLGPGISRWCADIQIT